MSLFGLVRLGICFFKLVDYADESLHGPKFEIVARNFVIGDEILLERLGIITSLDDFFVEIGLLLSEVVLHMFAVSDCFLILIIPNEIPDSIVIDLAIIR